MVDLLKPAFPVRAIKNAVIIAFILDQAKKSVDALPISHNYQSTYHVSTMCLACVDRYYICHINGHN